MAVLKYPSYINGRVDTLRRFGRFDLALPDELVCELPDEDSGELDEFEYLRGKVDALETMLFEDSLQKPD